MKKKIVKVYHTLYGCDTGCCGHILEVDDVSLLSYFRFDHFDQNDLEDREKIIKWVKKELAQTFGEEHLYDIDWENSEIVSSKECVF